MWRVLAMVLGLAPAGALADRAGEFDYYVLALSWSPNWCALEGDARDTEQCRRGSGHGWTLHGLWPQYERGWPADCPTSERPPSRAMTSEMTDIMGSSGLAWHQWRKHGVCDGTSATQYFAKSRDAYGAVIRPDVFRKLPEAVRLPASVVEKAFLRANPDLAPDMITVTCRAGHIQEVRLCLTRDLEPRICGRDVRRDCALDDALFAPTR
ncbi:MAG: ribonuclease T2 [Pseudomonadota bacterium]